MEKLNNYVVKLNTEVLTYRYINSITSVKVQVSSIPVSERW